MGEGRGGTHKTRPDSHLRHRPGGVLDASTRGKHRFEEARCPALEHLGDGEFGSDIAIGLVPFSAECCLQRPYPVAQP